MACVPVDPVSIAAEIAATSAAASISGKIGEVLKRRECRRELARNVWVEVVKRSKGRLTGREGYLDSAALWEWTNRPEVRAALLSADPAAVRLHGDSARLTWRTSTYDETNPLLDDDGRLAAELVFYLLVVDVLAGDELLSTYAARILHAVEDVHNELALVCLTLAESHVDTTDAARRRLAAISDGVLGVADRGLTQPGGGTVQIERATAERDLASAIEGLPAGTALLVVGQPDVGKSHLTMTVLRRLRRDWDVFALDLRRHKNSISELESALGESFRTAVAAVDHELPPVVAIDGAEAIQTVGPDLLQELVARSVDAGCRVVLISRSDASADINQVLARSGVATTSFEVVGLSGADLTAVIAAVPGVQSLTSLPVGAWLARRPGLLQAWLVLKPAETIQNEGHLVDLLRHQYMAFAGPGRQARVDATTALARVELGDPAGPIDSLAIDQLRNSGVLAERNNTWETRLVFSDDLWRDAAIAGLIADNPGILGELSAVRSAMRAAVIACQMRLNSDLGSIVSLVELFAQVASRTGQARWGEVPFEALASLGGSRTEWAEILDHLVGNGMLGHFLSAARRTASSLLSDAPLAMTGLVDALLDSHTEAPEVTGALRAWLEAGAICAPNTSSPTRQRVCAHLLETAPGGYPSDQEISEWLNDLAMCGVDLTPEAVVVLRRNATERPHRLDDVFRALRTGYALAESQPDLLIELCESYYIVREGWSMEALRAPQRGFGAERFSAFHTPVAQLLRLRPREALALASRILDAACERRSVRSRWEDEPGSSAESVQLELPDRGVLDLAGGADAWMWYRGGIASPVSAVNILLAIERFADQLIGAGMTVDRVTEILLRGTQSVPLVGLCVGLCIRHLEIDAPSEAFMCWARQPEVWKLEIARLTQETIGFGFLSTNDVANEDRRRNAITSLAPQVAASTILRGDEASAGRLEAVSAAFEASRPDDPVVRMWAWTFRPSAMRVEFIGETQAVVIEAPDDLEAALTAVHGDSQALQAADHVAMRNMYRSSSQGPNDDLAADVAVCQSKQSSGSEWDAARINAAAAALRASLSGDTRLSDSDVRWAITEVLTYLPKAQAGPAIHDDDHYGASSLWRPLAALASVLPPLRSATVDEPTQFDPGDIRTQVEAAVLDLARLGGADILWILLAEPRSTWRRPCVDHNADSCPNLLVAEVCDIVLDRSVQTVAASTLLSSIDHEDDDEVRDEATRFVQPDLLLAPLALAASAPQLCSHVSLDAVLDVGLELHAEPFREFGRNPHTDGNHFPRLGQALFSLLRTHRVELVGAYIEQLAPNFQAQALRGIRQVAGDDPALRQVLGEIWPDVISRLDRVLTHGDRWADAHAELVPTVAVDSYSMTQPDAWNEATANWINPRAVEASLFQWTQGAAGCGKCAGALGSFMLSADPDWLRETGLPLLCELLTTVSTDALKDRSAAWLADVPNDPRLADALIGNERLLAIIDRYVQADDQYALMARELLEPGSASH